mmetsp:Transcript_19600/g.16742  ORF Transcript_19600/g.16742 Transcript_19600/m.16742 type:complete len:102 (+) Transcript_19600:571-876(+)
MSGTMIRNEKRKNKNIYYFEQKKVIPSYLIALVAGNLTYRDLSDRSRVFSEPEMIESCETEFEDVDIYLSKAEELLTPYEWGRYDFVVMPPSYPFGGMENP